MICGLTEGLAGGVTGKADNVEGGGTRCKDCLAVLLTRLWSRRKSTIGSSSKDSEWPMLVDGSNLGLAGDKVATFFAYVLAAGVASIGGS